MHICKLIGCINLIPDNLSADICDECLNHKASNDTEQMTTSGADNDYWVAHITDPKRLEPCSVECDDLIELFQMSYQEGEAFKAQWRNGMLRLGKGKPGDTHLRNAQKTHYYSGRQVVVEERKLAL